ncbi:MAG: glycosyltransferase family 4 protein [Gammaproteobacteria bacterium]|nr:glycosyltransferase family 4 protein [Gammaproteobacteria bacterium]MBU2058591.1 glycosyltransferase family 4 protein [Gammaproteobacteria bacterium]MBU2173543.1 glycosyltransferase family 4 protein [Gammaproteobacteria bacterium]MBU2246497.1 glycosyltransferase family 4 protein [Gammaproteobacteria bacterium]MBU2344845.1 glycosyltransferase family 4 protein [Gammaproteobacteria bacterium]
MTKAVLIITNMGPKASAPFQGQFVKNQVLALQQHQALAYFYMSWHNDSLLNKLLKYPVLFLQFFWSYILSLKSYDIIHVHFFYPTIWLALAYKYLRKPSVKIVVTCHGSDIYHYQPFGVLYRWCSRHVDQWIFTSEKLQSKAFTAAPKAVVLSAGIAQLYADATQYSRADKDIDLLYVGALNKNKGMDRLIALLPQLKDKTIYVAGTGSYQAQFEQLKKDYPNLQLEAGQSAEQLKALYQRSKCFLSLSRNESFGLVMTEAMACYTPVIATLTDGSAEQLGADSFWVIDQTDEQALQQNLLKKIQQLLSLSDSDYTALQQSAHQHAKGCLVDDVAAKIQQLYLALFPEQGS